ncbi:MAG: hypothetical protein WKF59_05280 [Chitinophagaceae bacterium]
MDSIKLIRYIPLADSLDNPFLIAHEMTNAISSNNVVGSIAATYDISQEI